MYGQSILFAAAFIAGTTLLAWAVYFGARALLHGEVTDEAEKLAGSVIFRVSALHGLILALVFAQEIDAYSQLRLNVIHEATAIADIWNDAARYDPEQAPVLQGTLERYVHLVIVEEWPLLATRHVLSAEGWKLWDNAYQAILDLEPDTLRREALQLHMLQEVQKMAELRQQRENNAIYAMSALFWFAAIAGVVLVSVPYLVFSPTRLNLAILSVYGTFTGIVMFVIYAFSDPFDEPAGLPPAAFERLLETEFGSSVSSLSEVRAVGGE